MNDRPVICYYGDSIVSGYLRGGSPDRRWSTVTAVRAGATEVNVSQDGMGYSRLRGGALEGASHRDNSVRDRIAEISADLIVVCLGINDIVYLPQHVSQVQADIDDDFAFIARSCPGTPVIVSMYYPVAELSQRSGMMVQMLVDGCDRYGYRFTEALMGPTQGHPALLCNDGIHPSDLGHRMLADAMQPLLDATLAGNSSAG